MVAAALARANSTRYLRDEMSMSKLREGKAEKAKQRNEKKKKKSQTIIALRVAIDECQRREISKYRQLGMRLSAKPGWIEQ